MRKLSAVRRATLLAGALLFGLLVGEVALWQGGAFPALAATSATSAPCLVDRDLPYSGGAAPAVARPATPPTAPRPAIPNAPDDRYIPPRPPLQNPCQLRLLDERGMP